MSTRLDRDTLVEIFQEYHIHIPIEIIYIFYEFYEYITRPKKGGLAQLVAYGSQDIYLTTVPQITYFQVIYSNNTNFSVDSSSSDNNDDTFGKKKTYSR